MTWALVGLLFGFGFMAAAVLAVAGVVVLAACVSAVKGKEEERMVEVRGGEGTD